MGKVTSNQSSVAKGNASAPRRLQNSPVMMAVFELIAQERICHRQLQAAGKFKHGCDSLEISSCFKLAVLTEELGEVAREAYEMHEHNDFTPERRAKLRQELVQVAAVTVAWLETPEVQS